MSQQAITAYHEHWTYCSQILDSLFAHLLVRSNLLFIVLLVVRLSVVLYISNLYCNRTGFLHTLTNSSHYIKGVQQ